MVPRSDGAKALGVSRNALSELVNERRGVSPEMAIRLAKAFGSTPEAWAGIQLDYDMAQAMRRANRINVVRVSQSVSGVRGRGGGAGEGSPYFPTATASSSRAGPGVESNASRTMRSVTAASSISASRNHVTFGRSAASCCPSKK